MAKITKLEPQTRDGKASGFKINLDNGSWGYLNEKESDKGLREGDEVTFTEETPTGKTYKKITVHKTNGGLPPQPSNTNPPSRPEIHVGAGKSAKELKADASTQVLLKILDAYYEGKLESAHISVQLKEYDGLIWSEIDEIFNGK